MLMYNKVFSTPSLSSFTTSHVRKNTRLSLPTQLQYSHSRAWQPGNKDKIELKIVAILFLRTFQPAVPPRLLQYEHLLSTVFPQFLPILE